jgi:3-phosphoshikimate 1-carboxyvinyltransferase
MASKSLQIGPFQGAKGQMTLPGSKSISNRALLLAALASGSTTLKQLLDADDTQVMRNALRQLGVKVEDHGHDCEVTGCAGIFPVKRADLFMGNAGTAIRPLAAALVMQEGEYRLSGVPRMHERPIGDLVDGLQQIGAQIAYEQAVGYPPIQIHAARVAPPEVIRVRGDVSSQFLTALLMALPLVARKPIQIEVIGELISRPYINITIQLMAQFGVEVKNPASHQFVIVPTQAGSVYKSPQTLWVEGDASSASYFLAAGVLGRGPVRVLGVGKASIQGDIAFADAIEQMGARVLRGDDFLETCGVIHPDGMLRGITIDCTTIPDAAMTLAVMALFAQGKTRLEKIASWRVKETDRIAAMATELRKLGAVVHEGDDFLEIHPLSNGQWQTPPMGIDTYDDHRMAMCFSLVAFGPKPILINDPQCVAKTFPHYFSELVRITY